ncbi:hypothetical protein LTR53_007783 [Teratosphaeriaceae sp. CCFEE 6253]|nr:hypothetical protein LTR53_007783 [Teratosphaeriaceae sp. CCFEE 6253]
MAHAPLDCKADDSVATEKRSVKTSSAIGAFVALSYQRGPPEPAQVILLNGRFFPVTPSLFGALWAVRHALRQAGTDDAALWVDAICINQQDLDERSRQVSRMRAIYTRASIVYCCLTPPRPPEVPIDGSQKPPRCGGDPLDVGLALEVVQYLEQKVSHKGGQVDYTPAVQRDLRRVTPPEWRALTALLNNTYWGRLWIIQEIALASQVTILIDGSAVAFLDLWLAAMVLTTGLETSGQFVVNALQATADNTNTHLYATIVSIELVQRALRQDRERWFTWPTMLTGLARSASCEDPRDRVFGMLGLIGPSQAARIQVGYSSPVEDVYTDYAASMITQTGSLRVLEEATKPAAGRALPSWVPDLGYPRSVRIVGTFAAARALAHEPRPRVQGKRLAVRGCVIDHVDGLTAANPDDSELLCPSTDAGVVQATSTHNQDQSPGQYDDLERELWSCLAADNTTGLVVGLQRSQHAPCFGHCATADSLSAQP